MNLVDTFYQRFIFLADSAMLVGFKIGEQVFDENGVDLVFGGGRYCGRNVLYYIHERIIERRRRNYDKVGG